MLIAMYMLDLFLHILIGFCLGSMYFLWKIRKIQKKTRKLMAEHDVRYAEYQTLKPEDKTLEMSEEVLYKLQHIGGRIEATGEFFN